MSRVPPSRVRNAIRRFVRWRLVHWIILSVVTAVSIGLTVDVLGQRPPRGFYVNIPDALSPCMSWSFLLVFELASLAVFRRVWRRRHRAMAYLFAIVGSALLALPFGMLFAGMVEAQLEQFKLAHWNASLQSALSLRGWSYRRAPGGVLHVSAEIVAGRDGKVIGSVTSASRDHALCETSYQNIDYLEKGQQASLQWDVRCRRESDPEIHSMEFVLLTPGVYGEFGSVYFCRDASERNSDGYTFFVPLPPPGSSE